jgi:hypothetical protein
MKTIVNKFVLIVLLSQLISCGPGQLFGPTLTPTSTNTPTYTYTPTYTITSTATATFTSTPTRKPTITPLAIVSLKDRVLVNENASMLLTAFEAREVHYSLFDYYLGNIKCLEEGKKCLIIETKTLYGNIKLDDVNSTIKVTAYSNEGERGVSDVIPAGTSFSMGRGNSDYAGFLAWAFIFNNSATSYKVRINGIEVAIESPEYFDIYYRILTII